jgi:hypothetical protein
MWTLLARLDAAMAGLLVHTPLPWPALDRLARPLMPGSITFLAGDPGASKSFMLIQAALAWLEDGLPVALLELEESAPFWQQRAMALLAGNGQLTDLEHVRSNPKDTRAAYQRHRRDLDRFAAALTCAPTGGMTLSQVSAWIQMQVAAGAKLLIVDPITAADEGREPWSEARVFMSAAQAAITGKAALIISTHGKKRAGPKQPPGLDDLAGAAAYGRFCSSALWLEAHPEPEPSTIVDADGRQTLASCNRSVRILKARNGKGTGLRVGFHFSGSTLRLDECGAMATKSTSAPAAHPNRAQRLMQSPQAAEDLFRATGR